MKFNTETMPTGMVLTNNYNNMNIDVNQAISHLYHMPLADLKALEATLNESLTDLQKLNVALQDELNFRERATITPQDEEYERMAWIANQD